MPCTLIAHRCGPGTFPEQTIASARRALLDGADCVEMDVRYTLDGMPVICHDPNALRIFGEDQLVAQMPLARFLALRHQCDRSQPAHALEDVLACGVAPLLLHCKVAAEWLDDLLARLKAWRYDDKVILGVMDVASAARVKRLAPHVQVLAFMPGCEQLDEFLAADAQIIRLWEEWTTPAAVGRIRAAGKRAWIMAGRRTDEGVGYTDAQNLRDWPKMGVDGILVNDIPWARRVLDQAAHNG